MADLPWLRISVWALGTTSSSSFGTYTSEGKPSGRAASMLASGFGAASAAPHVRVVLMLLKRRAKDSKTLAITRSTPLEVYGTIQRS